MLEKNRHKKRTSSEEDKNVCQLTDPLSGDTPKRPPMRFPRAKSVRSSAASSAINPYLLHPSMLVKIEEFKNRRRRKIDREREPVYVSFGR